MPEAMPLVWIVILHWRGVEHTEACLESLRTLRYGNYKVLLVDNGSEQKDGKSIQLKFPEAQLLELESNRGFSGGCNAGIEKSLENQADFVWLLNNDAKVQSDTLSLLVDAFETGTSVGAASASIVSPGQQSKVGKGNIDFINAKAHLRSVEEVVNVSCDWISGSNMLLSGKALQEIGGLNDDYFLYFEDVEICVRLRQRGYNCLFVPGASIEHADGASTEGEFVHWRYYYHCRNRLIFFSNYPAFIVRLYCTWRIYLHILRHSLVLPFRGAKAKQKLKVEQRALKDFLSGVTGKVDLELD